MWLGLSLWRIKPTSTNIKPTSEASFISSFLAGFLLTLGDQKAIFFYLSFFPAFIDLSTLSIVDAATVVAIATTAVGGIKLGYALIAARAGSLLQRNKVNQWMNLAAGSVMIAVGLGIILK